MKRLFTILGCGVSLSSYAGGGLLTPVLSSSGGGGSGTVTNVSNNTTITYPFLTNTVYVSTTGSDATGTGSITSPVATTSNAANIIHYNGTIIVRGGNYTNNGLNIVGFNGSILGYSGERPKFWFGSVIPSVSWVSTGVNGVYTNSPNASFSNSLCILTNTWDPDIFHKWGAAMFQASAPYGTQSNLFDWVPPVTLTESGYTNRCENSPIFQTNILVGLNTNNMYWNFSNGILSVKFAVSNVPGDIYIPSTNATDSFVYGGTADTRITIQGIEVYGAIHGFNMRSCGTVILKNCFAQGSFSRNFLLDVSGQRVEMYQCEGTGSEGVECEIVNNFSSTIPLKSVIVQDCYFHDYLLEGLSCRQDVSIIERGDYCWPGTNGYTGFVSDGAVVKCYNCFAVSQGISPPYQMGRSIPLGYKSYMGLYNCFIGQINTGGFNGIELADQNDTLQLYNDYFYVISPGTCVAITGTAATDFVDNWGCISLITGGVAQIAPSGGGNFFDHNVAYPDDQTLLVGVLDARASGDSIVAENGIRLTTYLRQGSTTLIDSAKNVTNLNSVSAINLNTITNIAVYKGLTNVITTGGFWTNTTGSRVTLYINYTLTDTVSGDPGLLFTNISNGDWFPASNSVAVATTFPGRVQFDMSTNDIMVATNKSSGTATTTIDRSYVVIK